MGVLICSSDKRTHPKVYKLNNGVGTLVVKFVHVI